MKTEDKRRLEKYRDSVFIPLANTDPEKWPIRAGRIGQFTLDLFSMEFLDDLKRLQSNGCTIDEIGKLFKNPSRLWRMSHHFLKGLKMSNLTLEKQRSAMLTYLDLIQATKFGDIFNENGENIILTPAEVQGAVKGLKESNRETSMIIHRLAAILWAYAETVYFVAHEISVEIHGPYELDESKKLVIRDYFNLKPSELWKECGDLPYDTIQISTVYEGLDVRFDVYDNPYCETGRFVDLLTSYKVLFDGHQVDIRKVVPSQITSIILSVTRKVQSWNLKQIAKKYSEIFWYRKKPLKDALGEDWRPPKTVYDRIDSGEIPPEAMTPPNLEKLKKDLDLASE
jgi:hypothetical protein